MDEQTTKDSNEQTIEWSESSIREKIYEIIDRQLPIEDKTKIRPDANFIEDLSADSLDIVELIMALESTFNFEIPDEDAEKFRLVSDVEDYVIGKVVNSE